jgi:tetratricopeptide (TPR) repeat protein
MTRITFSNPNGQPSLSDLMVRFLATRSDAAAAAVELAGDVEPHEVAAGFRVDPRAAWTDAIAAIQPAPAPLPTDWASLVNQSQPAFAVAMAAGNFPQRVKDLQPLLAKFDAQELRPAGDEPAVPGFSGLRAWIESEAKKGTAPSLLQAAGLARTLGDCDRAEQLLGEAKKHCTGKLEAVWNNERAALDWHRGRAHDALAAWSAMASSPAVLFNRGMALLFLGRFGEARAALAAATDALPEGSGWNDLAQLYLALAEIQLIAIPS